MGGFVDGRVCGWEGTCRSATSLTGELCGSIRMKPRRFARYMISMMTWIP